MIPFVLVVNGIVKAAPVMLSVATQVAVPVAPSITFGFNVTKPPTGKLHKLKTVLVMAIAGAEEISTVWQNAGDKPKPLSCCRQTVYIPVAGNV